MIDVSSYLEDAISFLTNQDLETFNKQFMYQQEYLDSQDFNYTLKNIENNLNILYQKSRVIEDLINYAKEYVTTNIYTITDECKTILDEIEDNVDSLRTSNYISKIITFEHSSGSYLDRNGVALPECAVFNNTLSLSNKINNKIEIKSITVTNNLTPYRSNSEALLSNESYRSFYMLDNPIKDGLKEQVNIEFKTPSPINQLNIITSNRELTYLEFHNANGTIDYIEKDFTISQKTRTVKSISFITSTKNYNTLTYYVDESRAKNNYWDTLKSSVYNNLIGGKTLTQAEIDELTGMIAFKNAYKDYKLKIDEWIADRKRTMEVNIANGYNDSMENINIFVVSDSVNNYINSTLASSYNELTHNYQLEKAESTIISPGSTVQQVARLNTKNTYPDVEGLRYEKNTINEYSTYTDKTGAIRTSSSTIGKQLQYTSPVINNEKSYITTSSKGIISKS